ncbi:MAG: cohesin domain-containing protein [Patescibacteria group bacterium]|nr:cohesin domain-containing protein [Patescibacteria group bacterium]
MRKIFILLIFSFFILFFEPKIFGNIRAAFLKLDPATVSISSGNTFQVSVIVDSGSEQITGTDFHINFNSSLLEAQSVAAESFFPNVTNNITSGDVYIAAMVNEIGSYKTGSGTVAKVTFKALTNGTATISFDCNSSTIVKNDYQTTNIFSCSESSGATVTIGSGGGNSNTNNNNTNDNNNPTDETNSNNNNSTLQTLPQTGILENLIKLALPGAILLIIGGVANLILL